MDRHFATLQQAIASDPSLQGKAKLVSISFDPDHDSPAVLLAHAKRLKADPGCLDVSHGRSGDARSLCGQVRRRPDPAGRHGRDHAQPADDARRPDGRLVRIYSGNEWSPSKVLDDLRTIVKPPA
jgi:protein SCO1/2